MAKSPDPIHDRFLKRFMASLVDEWIAQGKVKGEANILMRLLSRRFEKLPDHIKDKISNANSDKIKI